MKTIETNERLQNTITLTCGGIAVLIIIWIMNRDYPFVGHDYAYFIPRLIDTNLHILVNGFTIQWYTPSFGGGLPGFPNPQHMEYSIVQLMSLFTNPWLGILISTAAISMIGYYFFYRFLKQNLELNWMTSTLGAMFFISNGFYIEHLIAGQLGYQLFPLFGIILYVLTGQGERYLFTSAVVALIMSMMIHQAGFYLIVILMLSIAMMLCILSIYKPATVNLRKLGSVAVLSLILTFAMTASKAYAAMAFMRQFPRDAFDSFNAGLFQGLVGIIVQLLGVMSVVPFLNLTPNNPGIITGIFSDLTGAKYGIWETDTGISPVLIFFLFVGMANAILSVRRENAARPDRSQLPGFLLLALTLWITVEFTLAKGPIYSLTKELPILRSLHVNVRFASAFISPLILVGAFHMHHFFAGNSKPIHFMLAILVTLLTLFSYFSLSAAIHIREYNVDIANAIYKDIQNGTRLPVESIAEIDVWRGFSANASSIKPYEPIFGYKLEEFTPQIHLGKILEADGGYFNMTNPASLVFPELNDLQPFERFQVSEQDQLEIFLARRQPEWLLPQAQKLLNGVSIIGLIFTVAILFWGNFRRDKHKE